MKNILNFLLIPIIGAFVMAGCSSIPIRGLYAEPIAENVEIHTVSSHFDVSYSIDCHLMKRKNKDFISFKIDTMLYTYSLDFGAYKEIRRILDKFFTISAMADAQKKKNGTQYLGESTLYAYASFQDTSARLSVNGPAPNRLRFSFLLKNGEKFLLLNSFHARTIDGYLAVDDFVDGVPFRYADIKKVYDFFTDKDALAALRTKQLHIKDSVSPNPEISPNDKFQSAGESEAAHHSTAAAGADGAASPAP